MNAEAALLNFPFTRNSAGMVNAVANTEAMESPTTIVTNHSKASTRIHSNEMPITKAVITPNMSTSNKILQLNRVAKGTEKIRPTVSAAQNAVSIYAHLDSPRSYT